MQSMTVRTTSGTIFRINPKMKFWEHLKPNAMAGLTRTAFGFYNDLNWEQREDGLRLALSCDERNILSEPVRHLETK